MLSVSAGSGRSRPSGVLLVAAGSLALLLAYWVLRDDRREPAREVPAGPSARENGAAGEAVDDVAQPAAPRPRRQPATSAKQPADAPEEAEPLPSLSPEDAAGSAVRAVLSAAADPSQSGTNTLIANLTSEDEVVVAEAARALVARRATEAIGPLSKIELSAAAGSGLSIIDALGKLGGAAEGAERTTAVDRLIAMLAEEKRRGARESPGNLIQIYEALGQTGDPRAAPPLEAELLDPSVPRAPKVVIVASLVLLGQDSSRAAFETALATERAARGSDDFEEEIRVELVSAIEAALGLR